MPLRALIFDVDGTLAETEELHRTAFNAAFREAGLDWHWSRDDYELLLYVTGGRERISNFMQRNPDWAEIDAARLHAEKTRIYNKMLAENPIPLRPGIRRLVTEARNDKIALAIATTTSRANVITLLENVFAEDHENVFQAIVCGEDVSQKKPSPEAYQTALRALNTDAGSVIVFEDSANGLLSARGAGLATIVTPAYYTRNDVFSGAISVLSDLGEPDRPAVWMAGLNPSEGHVTITALRSWLEHC